MRAVARGTITHAQVAPHCDARRDEVVALRRRLSPAVDRPRVRIGGTSERRPCRRWRARRPLLIRSFGKPGAQLAPVAPACRFSQWTLPPSVYGPQRCRLPSAMALAKPVSHLVVRAPYSNRCCVKSDHQLIIRTCTRLPHWRRSAASCSATTRAWSLAPCCC